MNEKQKKALKGFDAIDKLELKCFKHTANAEDFEECIKANGLTMGIINMIRNYFAEDLEDYSVVKY